MFIILIIASQIETNAQSFDVSHDCYDLLYVTIRCYSQWNETYIYKVRNVEDGFAVDIYDEYLNNYELFFDYTLDNCLNYPKIKLSELMQGHKFILRKKNCKEINTNLKLNEEKFSILKRQHEEPPLIICRVEPLPKQISPKGKYEINSKYFENFPEHLLINRFISMKKGTIHFLFGEHGHLGIKDLSREQFIYLAQLIREYKYEFETKDGKHKDGYADMLFNFRVIKK